MKYGEDYKAPCLNYAIDCLNDEATSNDAYSYFSSSDTISANMMTAVTTKLEEECYFSLQFFQLSGIDLPDAFEDAISETQVMDQQIITATQD